MLGKRIRLFRSRKGLKQKELGEMVGFMGKTSDVLPVLQKMILSNNSQISLVSPPEQSQYLILIHISD